MATSRRSCLSVPGSSERMLAKAQDLAADEVVIDLEDSVVPERKEEARAAAAAAVREGKWGRPARSPCGSTRSPPSGAATISRRWPTAGDALGSLVIPKVESPEEVEAVDRCWPRGLGLQALVETAAGLAGRPRSLAPARGWRR